MCRFFSFVGNKVGEYHYFDYAARKQLREKNIGENPDSHTYILDRCGIPVDRHHHWSKYEYDFPTKTLTVDQGVEGHDHEAAAQFARGLKLSDIIGENAVLSFKVGHIYRYIGKKKRPSGWNNEGLMDAVLDGEPRKCIKARGESLALFMGLPKSQWSSDGCWSWEIDLWEEVKVR